MCKYKCVALFLILEGLFVFVAVKSCLFSLKNHKIPFKNVKILFKKSKCFLKIKLKRISE